MPQRAPALKEISMAAQFKNIIVKVVDDSGGPLQNAAVTLLGGASPQVLATDASGQCTFSAVPPGPYRLMIVGEGFNTQATSVTHTDTADKTVTITMKVVNEESAGGKRSFFFHVLTGLQYAFLATLAVVFAIVLYQGFHNSTLDFSNTNSARGMITFVVSVVTVGIALILVMGAAFMSGSKDLDKRFAFGKEVFTVLVGVLGTVMGFYYGQAAATGAGNVPGQTIQIAEAKVDPPTPIINKEFTLTANITGGTAPYKYTVTFKNKDAITGTPQVDVVSNDGSIKQKFTLANTPALAGQPLGYTIATTDKNGLKGSFEGTFTPTSQ
jgi:hypothetical protein